MLDLHMLCSTSEKRTEDINKLFSQIAMPGPWWNQSLTNDSQAGLMGGSYSLQSPHCEDFGTYLFGRTVTSLPHCTLDRSGNGVKGRLSSSLTRPGNVHRTLPHSTSTVFVTERARVLCVAVLRILLKIDHL